ncbi:MAG: FAD-binding protein, partial [Clostridiales bacterium]|nr:FAD-binding protein [Clostridiales bacterium]
GGFSGDDEKLKKYEPGFFDGGIPVHRFSPPTCSGDGMELAAKVGGKVDMKKTKLNKFGPAHHPFTHSINRFTGPDVPLFTLGGRNVEMGPMKMGDSSFIDSIPEHAVWYVMDSKMIEDKAKQFAANPPDGNEGWIFETYMQDIETELNSDRAAKKGETLEELAANMGVDPALFVSEIADYNKKVAEKKKQPPVMPPMAEMFGMPPMEFNPVAEGPFYAFFGQRFAEGAFGGVITNEDIEVIRENGEVIPGLYAVGDAAGTWYTRGSLGPLTELTWAVASGYIAGCNAGDYISGKQQC